MKIIKIAAVILAAYAAPALADEAAPADEPEDVMDEFAQAEDQAIEENDNKAQYNMWMCVAIRRGYVGYNPRFFFSSSQMFEAGSGQGQQARYYALQNALRRCGGQYYCVGDCNVQRINF